jgi:alpha-tubulin suppressor-like RCC1 family protein
MKRVLTTCLALMLLLQCSFFMEKAYGYSLKEQAVDYAHIIKTTGERLIGEVNANKVIDDLKSLISRTKKEFSLNVQNPAKKLAAGNGFNIRIENGIPWVSGNNQKDINVTTSEKIDGLAGVKSVAAIHNHALFLLENGLVFGWGANVNGELGIGQLFEKTAIPVQMKNIKDAIAVAAGVGHSLILKSDGTVLATGLGTSGQIGNGLFENTTQPVEVKGLPKIKTIQAGRWHSLALDERGKVWSWGINGSGQLGNGNTKNRAKPGLVKNLKNIVAIACGSCHSLALNDKGEVFSWGFNKFGQVGDNSTKNRVTPQKIKALDGVNVTAVAVGRWHSLALDDNGFVHTWGNGENGQLGHGTRENLLLPKKVEGLTNITSIAAGECQSFAVDENGMVWGWGKNDKGEFGLGKTEDLLRPTVIGSLEL